MGLKIYLVERTNAWSYDDYDSFVCAVENEQEALEMSPRSEKGSYAKHSEHEYDYWTSISNLKATLLSKEADSSVKRGMILSSFNAG